MTNKKKNLTIAGGILLVVLLVLGMFSLYQAFKPSSQAGSKTITIDVVYADQTQESYTVTTDADYLEQALLDAGVLLEGDRTQQYGLMIHTVNGIRADYTLDQAYWAVLLDGQPCNYGISQQPIADSEHYQLVYTKA